MKHKILFIVPSLEGGGAERVMVTLANHLSRDQFEIHFAAVHLRGPYLKDLSTDVFQHDFHLKRTLQIPPALIRLIWRIRPDSVFTTIGHLNLATLITRVFLPRSTVLIIRESNTPSLALTRSRNPKLFKWLYRVLYPTADSVVCQSKAALRDLLENFRIPPGKLRQIYNPVNEVGIQSQLLGEISPFLASGPGPHLVAAGNLSYQKGFDILIHRFSKWAQSNPNLKLWIIGQGQEGESLANLVKSLGLLDSVHFVGFQSNPYRWFKFADLFILSSRYEGLPNVLLEALTCGCPVLVRQHHGGSKEILDLFGLAENSWVEELPEELDLTKYPRPQALPKTFKIQDICGQYAHLFLNP